MNDDELHESFYRSERYKESPTERYARLLAEVPTAIGEHEFALDYTETQGLDERSVNFTRFEVWRWLCSCGERGNWTSVSGDAAERGWREHVDAGEGEAR